MGVVLAALVLGGCGDDGGAEPLTQEEVAAVDEAIGEFVVENRGDSWPALSMLYSSAEEAVLIYTAGDGDPVELCQRFADFVSELDGNAATVAIDVYQDANATSTLTTGTGSGDCSS